MSSASPAGVIAHTSKPAARRRSATSLHSSAPARAIGSVRTSPMLTRTVRRLYGSVHVASMIRPSMPKARAARAMAPRFSASLRPSSTATRCAPTTRSSTDGCGRRSAHAITPRWRSNPTTSAITSRSATYTGTLAAVSSSAFTANRSSREGASSTDRTVCPDSIRRSIATYPSTMKHRSASYRRRNAWSLSER